MPITRTEQKKRPVVDEIAAPRALDEAREEDIERPVPISPAEQRTWPTVDVRAALRALDAAGEVGTAHHMGHEHYFTAAIPFYKGQPALPSPAERADIGALLTALKHDSTKHNATHAWEKLARIGAPAVPHLIGALDSSDHQQRILASSVLGRIGGREAVDALVSLLKDDDVDHNALAAYLALVAVGREALPELLGAVKSPDRQQATFARCLASVLEAQK